MGPFVQEESPRRADARRNAERVQRVALEVLERRGSEATVMDVAREAGVGKATVYRNFPTKASLLAFAAEHHGRWLLDRIDATLAASDEDRFAALIRDTMLRIRSAPILLESLRPHDGPEPPVGGAVSERLSRVVEAGIAAGRLRPDTTVDDLGLLIIGASEYLAARGASEVDALRAAELIARAVGRP